MHIQVNTDNIIEGREELLQWVEGVVNSKLGAVASHLTRVEVHIGDNSATREGPDDKRCAVEARPRGRAPVAVTHSGPTLQNAVIGAVDKVRNALDSELGKLKDRR